MNSKICLSLSIVVLALAACDKPKKNLGDPPEAFLAGIPTVNSCLQVHPQPRMPETQYPNRPSPRSEKDPSTDPAPLPEYWDESSEDSSEFENYSAGFDRRQRLSPNAFERGFCGCLHAPGTVPACGPTGMICLPTAALWRLPNAFPTMNWKKGSRHMMPQHAWRGNDFRRNNWSRSHACPQQALQACDTLQPVCGPRSYCQNIGQGNIGVCVQQ